MGILTQNDAQMILVDTPGFHLPKNKLGEKMVQEALKTIEECDLCLFLVDISQEPHEEDKHLAQSLSTSRRSLSIILAMNKADINPGSINEHHRELYLDFIPATEEILISATNGDNLDELVQTISSHLPAGPPFFPEDQLTDLYERDIAADLIREAILFNLRAEVPHSIAVRIDEFKDRDENTSFIAATLFVERDSQKGIVIGQGGKMLKQIGIDARHKIEEMTGRKIFLELRVKVRKNWRNDEAALSLFGYKT